jgi:DNA-directed RNA polymerase specialized sigma24 family protein
MVHDQGVRRKPAEGLEGVYRDEARRPWRAVYAYAGDSDIASDADSEAFVQCLERSPGVRSPAAWVWRAAFKIASGELQVLYEQQMSELQATLQSRTPRD